MRQPYTTFWMVANKFWEKCWFYFPPSIIRGVFRTSSNIYGAAISKNNDFFAKSTVADIQPGSKYAFDYVVYRKTKYRDTRVQNELNYIF